MIGLLSSTLLWADLTNIYIWFLIFVASSFGILGAIDDFLKIKNRKPTGLSIKLKFFCLISQSLFIFFTFAVNHFYTKIAFGGFGQSLFHFFTSGGFSANHFSTFHLRRSIAFPKKFASGGFSVNHFSIFSPPADFQLSIFKV